MQEPSFFRIKVSDDTNTGWIGQDKDGYAHIRKEREKANIFSAEPKPGTTEGNVYLNILNGIKYKSLGVSKDSDKYVCGSHRSSCIFKNHQLYFPNPKTEGFLSFKRASFWDAYLYAWTRHGTKLTVKKDPIERMDLTDLELAEYYAPRVYLFDRKVSKKVEKRPECRPSSIEFMLDRCTLRYHYDDGFEVKDLTVENLVKAANGEVSSASDQPIDPPTRFYLKPLKGKEQELELGEEIVDNVCTSPCYVRITRNGNAAYIQYWFFYPYNPAVGDNELGEHMGDWEHVKMTIRDVTMAGCPPTLIHFATNADGYDRSGTNINLSFTEDHHLKVYSAQHSHATFHKTGKHNRKEWGGIARAVAPNDYCNDTGPVWDTWKNIKLLGPLNAPKPGMAWNQFSGRWGKHLETGTAGATYGNSAQCPGIREDYDKLPPVSEVLSTQTEAVAHEKVLI